MINYPSESNREEISETRVEERFDGISLNPAQSRVIFHSDETREGEIVATYAVYTARFEGGGAGPIVSALLIFKIEI